MVFIANPFVLPLLVLIWSADAWLWLAAFRWILAQASPHGTTYATVSRITDPLPQLVRQWINRCCRTSLSNGLMWVLAIMSVTILRHTLVRLVMSLQSS